MVVLAATALGCLIAACAATGDATTGTAPHRAWTPELQLRYGRVSNPRLSPSGQQVAFEVSRADVERDRWVTSVHVAPWNGSGPSKELSFTEGSSVRWGASDATLFVLSPDDEGRGRVHRLDLERSSSTPVTPAEHSVGWFEPSPNGQWIAYTTLEQRANGVERWALRAVSVANGEAIAWDVAESAAGFAWSPSSDRIAAVHQPAETMDWRQKSLAILDVATGDVSRPDTGPGFAWLPVFGPEGRRVAYVASPGAASWMRDFELRVLDLERGAVTTLASTPDRNAEPFAWSPDGDALLASEYEGSTRRILSVPLDGSTPRYVGPVDRSIGTPHVRGGRVAFTSERWDEPVEVFTADLARFGLQRVSRVQPPVAAPLGRTETVRWTADDGVEVEGLLTYPVGHREGQRVPLLVRLHGGPPFPASDGFIGRTYFTAYPFASMASAGFAILQPNFRGSTGYGLEFRHGIHGDWGGQDRRDVLAGVDALVARGIADPGRLGIMGWSYGGYLTAWTITQDDRFAAASIGAAMTDLEAWDRETNLKGMLADWFGDDARAAKPVERSPMTFVESIRCPLLVQHGLNDRRVPATQGTAFASAAALQGVTVETRTFAGGHGPRTPSTELAVLEQNLDWFVRHLMGDGPDRTAP